MPQLVDFYRNEGTDTEGRFLKEIWAWDDEELEMVHDFIQWIFPLPEPSQYNPDAPLLTEEDIAAFRTDPLLKINLLTSLNRILAFLGLSLNKDGTVSEGLNFLSRAGDIWSAPNHNWLRITRIIRSLRLLGVEQEAGALYDRLNVVYRSGRFPITATTFRYWTNAAQA